MRNYRVQLEGYSGPMDLLLYLIRRDEIDIYDIPIARLLEQYLAYVKLLEMLDPDVVGDFLVLAATLMEIKSRLLLPKPPPEEDDDDGLDPRADLVRQLLAYRAFREAAGGLADRADERSRRFSRPRLELPDEEEEEVDIEDVQIWDLMSAFNQLLSSVGQQPVSHDVVYDDTPIALHAADVLDLLVREGPAMAFERIFEGRTRGEMIGLFLALLELIRQDRVRVEQPEPLGSILVHLIDATPITELSDIPAATEEDESTEPEEEAFEEEPVEPEAEGVAEPLFVDEEDEDEDDEYSRQIDAVEIGEVDLGRSFAREDDPALEDDEPADAEDASAASTPARSEAVGTASEDSDQSASQPDELPEPAEKLRGDDA